jgi:hypothetical protein
MSDFDDIARELHTTRAAPRPEFARELDQRAAGWLRNNQGRTPFVARMQRKGPVPVLVTAAAVAAIVVAFVVSGGGGGGERELEVAVVPDQGAVEALGGGGAAPEALEPQRDSAAPAEGGLSPPAAKHVEEGEPITVRYFFTAPTEGTVEFAGREAALQIGTGAGQLEIPTEGLPAGRHVLEIAVPAAPLYRERIAIGR